MHTIKNTEADHRETVVQKLKSYMGEHTITQKQLARMLNCSQSKISRIISDPKSSASSLQKLLQALGLDTETFVAITESVDSIPRRKPGTPPTNETSNYGNPCAIPQIPLVRLSDEFDSLLKNVTGTPKARTLTSIVTIVRSLLNAEACALFLIPNNSKDRLELEASSNERLSDDYNK